MDNSTNVIVVVYFIGSIITNTEQGVIFMSDEPTYFFVPQTMSFEELNVGLCEGINVGT